MSLRIAFDLDGVLADMDGELARQSEALSGSAATAGEPGSREQHRLWQHVRSLENFWETLDEVEPGSVSRLGKAATERRWEVIFLTKRPPTAGDTAQLQTQRWLESKGFTKPSVFVVQGSRGRIAAALDLDVVVDDRLENCMDVVVDSRARAVLVWREAGKQLPAAAGRLGIGVVHSVEACLEVLIEMGTMAAAKPRAMERVKRLLGLRARRQNADEM